MDLTLFLISIWVGSIIFFSAIIAPTVFKALDEKNAGIFLRAFFPKYYIRVENQWFSTVLRVRTTQGKEKSYVFETLVNVAKEGKKLRLFTNALRDPHLKGVSADSLFITD